MSHSQGVVCHIGVWGIVALLMLGVMGIQVSGVFALSYDNVEQIPQPDAQGGAMKEWQIAVRPGKVQGLQKKLLDAHTVQLTWKEPDDNNGFRVYRKKSGQSSYHLVATVQKSRYTDRDLNLNKTYRYRIVPILRFRGKIYKGRAAGISYRYAQLVAVNHQKYSYSELIADMKALVHRYPGKVRYQSIGMSEDGRNVYDIILGNPYASKKLLVIGAIHAREYMTSLLCMRQIEYYLENYYGTLGDVNVKSILSSVAIHFVPMANPDGVTISQYGIGAVQKASLRGKLAKISRGTSTVWKANARGVDLNRNFPVKFKRMGKRGYAGFSGKKALSESETRALVRRIASLRSGLLGVINYHATGSIIFGDYSGADTVGSRTEGMYRLARSLTGYGSAGGYNSESGGRGNLREYILYRQHIPCITVEIGKHACPGPISEFPSIWNSNRLLVLKEAQFLR